MTHKYITWYEDSAYHCSVALDSTVEHIFVTNSLHGITYLVFMLGRDKLPHVVGKVFSGADSLSIGFLFDRPISLPKKYRNTTDTLYALDDVVANVQDVIQDFPGDDKLECETLLLIAARDRFIPSGQLTHEGIWDI